MAYGGYTGPLRTLIHALKYDGILPIADRLGGLLAEAILTLEEDGTFPGELVMTAVPMHRAKQKQRGFNHADLLARAVLRCLPSQRAGRLALAGGVLERRRATKSQAGLSPHQRRANLRGVFFAPCPEQVAGRHFLLIDDIYTTGATARACSSVLLRAGAASVRVATVARPQREIAVAPQFDDLPMHEDVAFWGSDRPAVHPAAGVAGNRRATSFWGRDVFRQSHDQIDSQIDSPRT